MLLLLLGWRVWRWLALVRLFVLLLLRRESRRLRSWRHHRLSGCCERRGGWHRGSG